LPASFVCPAAWLVDLERLLSAEWDYEQIPKRRPLTHSKGEIRSLSAVVLFQNAISPVCILVHARDILRRDSFVARAKPAFGPVGYYARHSH
jgi:hypothetical protein